jgi:hypothetical protein
MQQQRRCGSVRRDGIGGRRGGGSRKVKLVEAQCHGLGGGGLVEVPCMVSCRCVCVWGGVRIGLWPCLSINLQPFAERMADPPSDALASDGQAGIADGNAH